MSRLTELREARDSYAVKFREFVVVATKRPDVLICFFEGEDVKYYGTRIEMLRPDLTWTPVNCGGKGVVIRLWQLISGHALYSKARVAYFVDADFTRSHPPAENIYVTPCYSIENLYVCPSSVARIYKAEFGLSELGEEQPIFESCLQRFQTRFDEFLDAVEPLNAWILYYRIVEEERNLKTKLHLNALTFASLVSVGLDCVQRKYRVFDLETAIPAPLGVTEEQVNRIAGTFVRADRGRQFRGKFQAHFMRIFLTKLIEDANLPLPTCFPRRRRVSFNISERNFLTELSQYADTPGCLREFIAGLN